MRVQIFMSAAAVMFASAVAFAGAEHKSVTGPKGGKILDVELLHAEFVVEKDRKVTIVFYDEKMKPVAVTDQVVNMIAEAPSGKSKLEFEKKDDTFVSKTALPEGDGYIVVVQIKSKPDAKPQNFRIPLHLEICGECRLAEYACVCESHSDGGHDHKH